MKSSLGRIRSLRAKKSSRLSRRVQRARSLRVETMEPRHLLAGFIQGFAFVDANSNSQLESGEVRKENATIQLCTADGTLVLDSEVTNSDGYYRFDDVASGTYLLREVAPGYSTTGVQIQNLLSTATAVNSNTEILVTLTEPSDPAWIDANPASPPNPNPLTVHRLPGLPGVISRYTLTGGPFNSSTETSNPGNAHQFELFLTGGALTSQSANFYSFCLDLFHTNPNVYPVVPSLVPQSPALATNIGRIGYLYNEFGTKLLSPTLGTALQLALYELEYDAVPNLFSGTFRLFASGNDPAAVAAAQNFIDISAGKDQRAVFLNVTPPLPIGNGGRQGMIVTENFNFANSVVDVQRDLRITITPDATNEVGDDHTFTVLVQQDDGLAAGAPGGDAVTGFGPAAGAAVTAALQNLNGASTAPLSFNGVADSGGQFQVTFSSATAGIVVGNATATHLVNGVSLTRDTDPVTVSIGAGPGGSGPASKRFVDAKIVITPDDVNGVGDPHTFTVTVYADDGLAAGAVGGDAADGFAPVGAGEDVAVTLDGFNGAVPDLISPSDLAPLDPTVINGFTDANGQFSVIFTSATAGLVIGSATSNVNVGGLELVRATDGTGNNSGTAKKRFVDARITIAPDATNEVGDPHTFTVTVQQDDGLLASEGGDGVTGFTTVGAGKNVAVTLTDTNGAAAVPSTALAGTTDAAGQFFVTFASAAAGQVIGNASTSFMLDGVSLTRDTDPATAAIGSGPGGSGPAIKTFVDANITITPDATNAVGDPHTFTVTVMQDDGLTAAQGGDGVTGFTAAVGESVAVTLANANGATADPAGPFVGVTDGAGLFQVTFTSATAGLVIGNASANVAVGGLILLRDTNPATAAIGAGPDGSGPATKRFVDAKISIMPNATNEVGDPHTFTVTVLQDDGLLASEGGDGVTGFAPATVGNVDVTLTDSNGAVSILDTTASTSDDNQPTGDNLDANGQTLTVFTSNTAGQVVGHATVTLDVGGVTLTRETDGLAGNSGEATKTFVDAKIIITPNATNEVGDPHTFTITVLEDNGDGIDSDGDGSNYDPAVGETVDVTLTDTNGAVSVPSTLLSGSTDVNGQFFVSFTSATAGQVTGHATSDVEVGGLLLTRETDGSAGNSDDAVKTFVDARITITPDATNAVGDPHTFTVTVIQDDGLTAAQGGDGVTGFVAAAGESVTVTLANANGALATPAGPFAGVTDALGQFQVTFSSATAGLVVGNASASVSVGGLILLRDTDPATAAIGAGPNGSGPATKRFVDAKISITPNATNAVGDPHTFTVTVLQDDGLLASEGGDGVTGFTAATVGNVDVTLTNSNGAVSVLNAAASTSDDNQPIGDNLNALGQTTTVFTSNSAGQVTGHATVTLVVGGVTLTRQTNGLSGNTGDAVKTFVDAKISIGPDGINPVGDPHTFTVTVLQDDGLTAAQGGDGVTGFTPATVGNVDVALTNSSGAVAVINNAASTSDDNQPTGDNLNALGQTTTVFTSATAGTVTGHATVTLVVGGVTLVRETNGLAGNSVDAIKKFVKPGIDIEKTTNGPTNSNPTAPDYDNEDSENGPGVPILVPGSTVTWTYKVRNTGGVDYAFNEVVIVDDNGTPANLADDMSTTGGQITFLSVFVGDADNILEPGEVWLYKASGIVQALPGSGPATTFNFTGNTALDGPDGNIRTFTSGGISVKASGFSRDKLNGAWSTAYVGSYSGGLGVTDSSEGSGGSNSHTVDNSGRDNYVLFEFSDSVVIDSAFLGYVVGDSDLTVWIGTKTDPFNNHLTLSDSLLTSLGFTEVNTGGSSARTADLNAGGVIGNVIVIAARTGESDDYFKIEKMTVNAHACYENKAVVSVPGATDSDLSHYCNPEGVPGIELKKFTNGQDADTADTAAEIEAGAAVTWTYEVKNTGSTNFTTSEIVITDDAGTPGITGDDFSTTSGAITFVSVLVGDGDNLLEPGEKWLYKASGIADDLVTAGAATTFDFSGNTSTDGTDGNIRTFTSGSLSVKTSAFSRDKSSGAWSAAYLGSYSGGLGVTDSSEGTGSGNSHTVDNSGRDNYVLFEFSESVIVDSAFLGYVVGDSDVTVWIGSTANPFINHLTLSDAVLTSLGFTEVNLGAGSTRWADFNNGDLTGNVLVISAKKGDADDNFKIEKLKVEELKQGLYKNIGKVIAGGVSDTDVSHYRNVDDCYGVSFAFSGNTAVTGSNGNVRSYTQNGVSVNVSGYSRTTSGTWNTAYVGAYSDGLGVTDSSENGSGGTHRVDNIGRWNYVLFEFSTMVEVDRAFLDSVVGDSDVSIWIGTKDNPFHNHLTLSDSLLSSLSFEDNTTGSSSSRWADFNAGETYGNVLVIAARVNDADDQFKIEKLEVCAEAVKFYVVDATAKDTFEYTSTGDSTAYYSLNSGNTAPRGVASTVAGNKVWVIDANKVVYVYDTNGVLLGSWTANGLTTPEDITTNGTDIWIVDAGSDKVFKYSGAATKISGNQNAASSFSLNSSNLNAKGIVTDGTHFWVVNDNTTDKVFKYTLSGTLAGSWTIDSQNGAPTGITIDPGDVNHLWIVDGVDDAVYRYNSAVGRTSGSQNAGHMFQLAGLNVNPQGIADPPPALGRSTIEIAGLASDFRASAPIAATAAGSKDRAFADLAPALSIANGRSERSELRKGAKQVVTAAVPAAMANLELTRLATTDARQDSFSDALWDASDANQYDATDEFFSNFDSALADEVLELVAAD